jgi:hypothetical protein
VFHFHKESSHPDELGSSFDNSEQNVKWVMVYDVFKKVTLKEVITDENEHELMFLYLKILHMMFFSENFAMKNKILIDSELGKY